LEITKSSFLVSSLPVVITSSVVGGIFAFLLLAFVLLLLRKARSSTSEEGTADPNTLEKYVYTDNFYSNLSVQQ
jgi:hypothetical protein